MRISARFAALLGALALAVTPLAPALASDVATRVGVASFAPADGAIAIPYTGATPKATLYTLSPTHHYYEIEGARLEQPAVQFHRVGGAIERYTVADRPSGAVRLSFTLTTPATPTLRIDAAHHRLLVWPLGRAAAVPLAATPAATPRPAPKPRPRPRPVAAKPRPKPVPHAAAPKPVVEDGVRIPTGLTPPSGLNTLRTEVGKPYFDDFHHRLVLPYKGLEPDFTVVVYYKNPRWVYFDFSNAFLTAEGQRFETFAADSAFEGWMLSQRKGGLKTRLYLKLKSPTQIVAQVHAESNQIWLELPGHTPAAATAPEPSDAPTPDALPDEPVGEAQP